MVAIIGAIIGIVIAFLAAFIVFTALERCCPLHKEQKVFRAQYVNDVVHFVINHFVTQIALFAFLVFFFVSVRYLFDSRVHHAIRSQHWALRFFEALVVTDFAFYFAHRLAHTVPCLWRFHAVHHSIQEMDWLASARLHPLDQGLSKALTILPLAILGFEASDFGFFLVVNGFFALLNHSNVNLNLGYLYYVVGTPKYHHIHHSGEKEQYDKNFSGIFPVVDMLFGTFAKPDHWPKKYGVEEPVPSIWPLQMAYPFKFWKMCCCFRDFQSQYDISVVLTRLELARQNLRSAVWVQIIFIMLNIAFVFLADKPIYEFQQGFRWFALTSLVLPAFGLLAASPDQKPETATHFAKAFLVANILLFMPLTIGSGVIMARQRIWAHIFVFGCSLISWVWCLVRAVQFIRTDKTKDVEVLKETPKNEVTPISPTTA